MDKLILVFAGGGLGCVARYGLGAWARRAGYAGIFPWHTFAANLAACIVLGLVAYGFKDRLGHHAILIFTAFCGGLSTFSTFSAETVDMINRNQFGLLALYAGLSLAGCIFVMWMISKA